MKEIIKVVPLSKLLPCICIAAGAIALLVIIGKVYRSYIAKHDLNDRSAYAKIIEGICRALVIVLAVLWVFSIFGVNITSAVAGLGIASAVVGLALQDYLKDVIMGMHIMSDSFYSVGDGVIYNGEEGVVTEFSMKTTKIKLLKDGEIISVCNRNIEEIIKLSDQLIIDIPLPYNEQQGKMYDILDSICKKISSEDDITDCFLKGTQSFENSSVMYRISVICTPELRDAVRRKAIGVIQSGLEEADVHIPFNQLDVHFDKNDG